jgi:hypothetical protein
VHVDVLQDLYSVITEFLNRMAEDFLNCFEYSFEVEIIESSFGFKRLRNDEGCKYSVPGVFASESLEKLREDAGPLVFL